MIGFAMRRVTKSDADPFLTNQDFLSFYRMEEFGGVSPSILEFNPGRFEQVVPWQIDAQPGT
jgi:hypothetical protein